MASYLFNHGCPVLLNGWWLGLWLFRRRKYRKCKNNLRLLVTVRACIGRKRMAGVRGKRLMNEIT